jgi:hypothetical protein
VWQDAEMARRRTSIPAGAVVAAMCAVVLAACGGTSIGLPPADELPAPGFVTIPDDLADSAQLAALTARDTACLAPDERSVDASLLPAALALLAGIDAPPRSVTRLSMYGESIVFSFYENGVAGRSVNAVVQLPYPGSGETTPSLSISEPSYADDVEFALDAIDPLVPGRIVAALAQRFPLARVTTITLDDLSYGFGSVWNLTLDDARGPLANVYADLDGSIVAVDLS